MIFDRRARIFLAITALLMASAIAFGAFGAHGLKNILTPEMLKVFHTGVEYQFYNTFGLFMSTVLTMLRPYNKKLKAELIQISNYMPLHGIPFSGRLRRLSASI